MAFPVEELSIVHITSLNGVTYSFDELLRHRSVSADLAVKMSRIKRGAVIRNTIGVINYDGSQVRKFDDLNDLENRIYALIFLRRR